jgi:hypothetical protein
MGKTLIMGKTQTTAGKTSRAPQFQWGRHFLGFCAVAAQA